MEDNFDNIVIWNASKKVAFRFFFLFFILFIIFNNNDAFPFWKILDVDPEAPLHIWIPWIGKNILHLANDITVFTNGSGDTTFHYISLLFVFVSAVLGCIIWSVFDGTRSNYKVLYYWLTVVLRYYIAFMLFNYGLYKIFKLQFGSPDLYTLTTTYDESTPMKFAWTFLGISFGYNIFMGIAELLSILLLFRRTMTAGALITLMTALNIMVINYCYDIPVKILSTTLVIMTLFLLMHDAQRLFCFFFNGEYVDLPVIKAPEIKNRILQATKTSIKFFGIGYVFISEIIFMWPYKWPDYKITGPSELYGVYDVASFRIGTDSLLIANTPNIEWKRLIVDRNDNAEVIFMNDSIQFYRTVLDTSIKRFHLTLPMDANSQYSFRYDNTNKDQLILSGVVYVVLNKKKVQNRLMGRGFHWINEYPFNK